MNETKNRRKRFFANKLHREIFLLIALSSLFPVIIVTLLLYYLIFSIVANQIAIPEAIAYNIIPAARRVTFILLTFTPSSIIVILIFTYKITHKIVGPLERIIRELDKRIENKKIGHIITRKTDKFRPLTDKINKLLDKLKEK